MPIGTFCRYLYPSLNERFWFPERPERVSKRGHIALFRGLETNENTAGDRKMPFMDGYYLRNKQRPTTQR